ncbi:hypothetical protein SEA_GARDENSTATE_18 [Microbacterium phage GardenState]|uniref:Uncharacterized protein n=2 Tax=Gardenstatevirus TaxID=3425012 RepID=A0A4Y6E7R4_9CAUD|nr:hypothetical protein SEA_IAMGROOT_18 [Microbacterium phage IAmGroot]QOI66930.1 hypothetical protein SEA_GARDENSTATE_18 [Microbacterium phage GardenState]
MAIEVTETTVTTHTITYTEDASDGSKMAAALSGGTVSLSVMGAQYTLPLGDVATLAALLATVAEHGGPSTE